MTSNSEPQTGDKLSLRDMQEREAATRAILEVISQSRADELPVFDVILENASRLCEAPLAYLALIDERRVGLTIAAARGTTPGFVEFVNESPIPLDASQAATAIAALERRVVQVKDLKDDQIYRSGQPQRVRSVDVEGARTMLLVPLIRGDDCIGVITLYRREVKLFERRHIDLVQTFAAQAVIAIENVHQFRELQTRLEREAATRAILEVISQSRADEEPVFDVILESACRLCEASMGMLFLRNDDGNCVDVRALRGSRPRFLEMYQDTPLPLDPSQAESVRAMQEKRVIHIDDLAAGSLYKERQPHRVHAVEHEGIRTYLFVPLISGGQGIGGIGLYRREVKPFSQSHIDLVKTFAEQAVIAVENVRQFRALEASNAAVRAQATELEALNSGLETRVSTQVQELERLGRLRRFLPPQVADAVVSSGNEKLLGSHRALIAILFADIRGFTAFCESAEPEEAIEVLEAYHRAMGRLIQEHGAGVDHRAGDGIMVIFNDPLPCDDPAGSALDLALAMRARMAELCADWRKLGHRLGFGIGFSLGYATVGMVGFEGRFEYTASGTAVNLASRLCDEAADGEILLSPRAYSAVEDRIEAEAAGELTLKGFSSPIDVFRVAGVKDQTGAAAP